MDLILSSVPLLWHTLLAAVWGWMEPVLCNSSESAPSSCLPLCLSNQIDSFANNLIVNVECSPKLVVEAKFCCPIEVLLIVFAHSQPQLILLNPSFESLWCFTVCLLYPLMSARQRQFSFEQMLIKLQRDLHNNNFKVTQQWVQAEPYDSQTQKCQTITFILNSNNKLPWHFISSRYQMNSLSEQLTN